MTPFEDDSYPNCLLEVDVISQPLLNEVWLVLEKAYNCDDRQWIFNNHPEKWISIPAGGFNIYHMPDENDLPVEFVDSDSGDWETELESFLYRVNNVECYREDVELKVALDAVNRLTDTLELSKYLFAREDGKLDASSQQPDFGVSELWELREILLTDIEYLQKNKGKIGRFVIIPDMTKKHKRELFTNFESFHTSFLKYVRPALEQKEIPTFDFGSTGYDHIILEIKRIADCLYHFFDPKNTATKREGAGVFADVYKLARDFELLHHGLFNPYIRIPRSNKLRDYVRTIAIKRKKELMNKGKSDKGANSKVQSEFENIPEYERLFILKSGEPWGTTNWKVFLQEPKNGKSR